MAQRTSHPAGTPSYVDLGTPDIEAASSFYSALFGWRIDDLGAEAGGYRMVMLNDDPVAGIGPAQNPGPPYWTTYVTVDNVEDTTKKVEAAGGSVLAPAMDVMTAGRMAVFADPNGAAFAVWQAGDSIGSYRVNEPGTLCWNELNTRNLEPAKSFYTDVFGWGWEGGNDYAQFMVGDRTVGGAMPMPEQVPAEVPDHWMTYFAVADINLSAAKVKELGGTTMMDPFPASGVGTMVVAMDPQGAVFSLIELDEEGD